MAATRRSEPLHDVRYLPTYPQTLRMQLNPAQMQTLRALCRAFIPSLNVPGPQAEFWQRSADTLQLAERMAEVIGALGAEQQAEVRQALQLLGSPLVGLTWGGALRPLAQLSGAQAEQLLQRWAQSDIALLRKAFMGLKKLVTFIYYSDAAAIPNPNWADIGYGGPLAQPVAAQRPLQVLRCAADTVLHCDTVVVGSGAGGAVVAAELAEAGHDVIIVEKGAYVPESEFTQREAEMLARLYEQRAAFTSSNGGVTMFAGSCLGGGTTVNWAGAFRTPDYILQQWASAHHVPHFTTAGYQRSLDAVTEAGHVGTDESPHNFQNQALWDGAQALGYAVQLIARNTDGCRQAGSCQACGYCLFGCRSGAKQGGLRTHIWRAQNAGARILVDSNVQRVLLQRGQAAGVLVQQGAARVTIHARRVVVAAGALHTPALLWRSGLQHAQLGRNLYLHPTLAVAADYGRPMRAWEGPMMSAVCNHFAQLDGNYGFLLETPPAHPGLFALALPWHSGRAHKQAMLAGERLGSFIVLLRDRDPGQVVADRHGQPLIRHRLSNYDAAHLLHGMQTAARVHAAAGAQVVYLPHAAAPEALRVGAPHFAATLAQAGAWSMQPNRFTLFSAHQMSTCRMGGNARTHPLAPSGELRAARGLFVADGSALPECSGVNPMLSIQALAHFIAQGIKAAT